MTGGERDSWGEQGDEAELREELALAHARLDEYSMQLEGVQQELRTEVDRNILSKQDVMSLDYHYGMHIMGTSWNATGDNPKNDGDDGLVTPGNWKLCYQTSKLVPIVQIHVNTPIAATPYQ